MQLKITEVLNDHEFLFAMRVLLPNRSKRMVALFPLDTRERRKALRLSAVIQTIAGRRRSELSEAATQTSLKIPNF
jgi:hypothetical protein